MQIPIENIYYLLCYAWNKLEEKEQVSVSIDDKTKLVDLCAKILINSTKKLLKRGINKVYIDYSTEIAGIKGKINISETLKKNLHSKQRAICGFDTLSPDNLLNQVLYTTLYRLTRTTNLDSILKTEIKQLLWMFSDIKLIELKTSTFLKVKLHRNNKIYDFILKVCHLLFESNLPSERYGNWKFSDFTRDDRKMNQLFEAFIRNFYRIEQKVYNVRRENIDWQLSTENTSHMHFLPLMQTDITLESKENKIIIDAKFYRETMISNYDKEKIRSNNLYQLFSYLINQEDKTENSKSATGILLYPTIEKDYDLYYKHGSHNISIKTINLNTDWNAIDNRLRKIIQL